MIERFFREITDKQIRRGSFNNVRQLIESIETFIETHNLNPLPFVWTAKVQDILEKDRRAKASLDKLQSA